MPGNWANENIFVSFLQSKRTLSKKFFGSIRMRRILLLILLLAGLAGAQDSTAIRQEIKTLMKHNKFTAAQKILELHKDKPNALYYLSVIHMVKGELDQAIDLAEEGLKKSNDKAKFYELLGDIYAVKAQKSGMLSLVFVVPKIKKNWKKALQEDPRRLSARQKLFSFYLMAPGFAGGDPDQALKIAQETLPIDSLHAIVMLGQYYQQQKQKQPEKAEQYFIQAERMATALDSTGVLREVGYFYLRAKNYPAARKVFERIKKEHPKDPFAYDNLADYYLKTDRKDSALVMLQKAEQLAPHDINIRFKRARVLADLGKFAEARALAQDLLKNEMFFGLREQIETFVKEMDRKMAH